MGNQFAFPNQFPNPTNFTPTSRPVPIGGPIEGPLYAPENVPIIPGNDPNDPLNPNNPLDPNNPNANPFNPNNPLNPTSRIDVRSILDQLNNQQIIQRQQQTELLFRNADAQTNSLRSGFQTSIQNQTGILTAQNNVLSNQNNSILQGLQKGYTQGTQLQTTILNEGQSTRSQIQNEGNATRNQLVNLRGDLRSSTGSILQGVNSAANLSAIQTAQLASQLNALQQSSTQAANLSAIQSTQLASQLNTLQQSTTQAVNTSALQTGILLSNTANKTDQLIGRGFNTTNKVLDTTNKALDTTNKSLDNIGQLIQSSNDTLSGQIDGFQNIIYVALIGGAGVLAFFVLQDNKNSS